MTQKDWENLGLLLGLFILGIVAVWVVANLDKFDGGGW